MVKETPSERLPELHFLGWLPIEGLSHPRTGYLPDLETFKAVCDWLEVNPGDVLGTPVVTKGQPKIPAVHFKKDNTTTEETAKHLANLIIYAQQALELQEQGI